MSSSAAIAPNPVNLQEELVYDVLTRPHDDTSKTLKVRGAPDLIDDLKVRIIKPFGYKEVDYVNASQSGFRAMSKTLRTMYAVESEDECTKRLHGIFTQLQRQTMTRYGNCEAAVRQQLAHFADTDAMLIPVPTVDKVMEILHDASVRYYETVRIDPHVLAIINIYRSDPAFNEDRARETGVPPPQVIPSPIPQSGRLEFGKPADVELTRMLYLDLMKPAPNNPDQPKEIRRRFKPAHAGPCPDNPRELPDWTYSEWAQFMLNMVQNDEVAFPFGIVKQMDDPRRRTTSDELYDISLLWIPASEVLYSTHRLDMVTSAIAPHPRIPIDQALRETRFAGQVNERQRLKRNLQLELFRWPEEYRQGAELIDLIDLDRPPLPARALTFEELGPTVIELSNQYQREKLTPNVNSISLAILEPLPKGDGYLLRKWGPTLPSDRQAPDGKLNELLWIHCEVENGAVRRWNGFKGFGYAEGAPTTLRTVNSMRKALAGHTNPKKFRKHDPNFVPVRAHGPLRTDLLPDLALLARTCSEHRSDILIIAESELPDHEMSWITVHDARYQTWETLATMLFAKRPSSSAFSVLTKGTAQAAHIAETKRSQESGVSTRGAKKLLFTLQMELGILQDLLLLITLDGVDFHYAREVCRRIAREGFSAGVLLEAAIFVQHCSEAPKVPRKRPQLQRKRPQLPTRPQAPTPTPTIPQLYASRSSTSKFALKLMPSVQRGAGDSTPRTGDNRMAGGYQMPAIPTFDSNRMAGGRQ